MPASVTLSDVHKSFGCQHVIRGVDLAISPSEFIVFVGPSGCGKSTLLRMIAGLERVDQGEIAFDGRRMNELSPAQRKVGMVFQSYALYPHMTVAENVGFALKLQKLDQTERRRRVDDALDILQLTALRDKRPAQLSGGQRQRVAIGRSIVRDPAVFLFDEPLSNLDTALRVQMRLEISRLHQRLKNTVIYVTHDQVEAMTLADRIVVFEGGLVQQVGAPLELYHRPANRFVASFLGSPQMGFLDAEVVQDPIDGLSLDLGSGKRLPAPRHFINLKPGSPLTIGIRPEDVELTRAEEGLISGPVLQVERLGAETFAFIDAGGADPIAIRVRRPTIVRSGETVGAHIEPSKLHLFAPNGTALPRLDDEVGSLHGATRKGTS